MNEKEAMKCPKCGGNMEIGHLDGAYHWIWGTSYFRSRYGSRIWGYACKKCGYVEFYKEKEEGDEDVLRKEGAKP